MDKNDLMKERKIAVDGMVELAGKDMTSENKEQFDRFKDAVDAYDRRLEAFMDLDKVKKPEFKKVPDMKANAREIAFEGGPANDRSYKGMFGATNYNEDEIRAFRDSMQAGIPSGGGMSVPEPVSEKWLDDALPEEIIRPRAQVWAMESGTRKVPAWDWTDMSTGAAFGGFTMAWTAELGTATAQTGKLRAISLTAYKGGIFVDASSEVVADGLGFAGQIEVALKKSIAQGMEKYFLSSSGTGVGCPKSVINDDSLISVSKETGQAADTLVFSSICKIFKHMYPGGRDDFVWIANHSCIEQLIQGMNVSIGTSGSWIPVLNDKDGTFKILGKEVVFTPHLPALGTANDLVFADLSQYYVGIRRDMRIQSSDIPSWTEDLRSYRILVRFDGMGSWDKAASPAHGDDLSWVVGLGARV